MLTAEPIRELPAQTRSATLSRSALDTKRRTIEVSFCSEAPVERHFGTEVLDCRPQSFDLSRVKAKSCPLLDSHDASKPVLGIVESARIDPDRVGRAVIRFSKSEAGQRAMDEVADGILNSISCGYRIIRMERDPNEDDVFRVTHAELLEISVCAVPADYSVGVARSSDNQTTYPVEVIHTRSHMSQSPAVSTRTNEQEQHRLLEIAAVAARYGMPPEMAERMMNDGSSPDVAKRWVMDNDVSRVSRRHADPAPGQSPLFTRGSDFGAGVQTRSIGELIAEHPDMRQLLQGGRRSVSFQIEGIPSFRAAILTSDVGTTIQHLGGAPVHALQRLTVSDLLGRGTLQAGVLRYPRENSVSEAGNTSEGSAKTEVTFDLEPIDAPLRKISAYTKLSTELIEEGGGGGARSYIEQRLGHAVLVQEEKQILTGDGVAPNVLGLLNTPGVQTQAKGADSAADAIRKGIGKIADGTDFEATGIVIHPNDWMRLELAKDANGQYLAGSIFMKGEVGIVKAPTLWSLPVAVSKGIPEGTALAGAFATASQLFRRHGVVISATNCDGNDFTLNLVTILAEERATVACYSPAAFCSVTGLL